MRAASVQSRGELLRALQLGFAVHVRVGTGGQYFSFCLIFSC